MRSILVTGSMGVSGLIRQPGDAGLVNFEESDDR